MRRTRLIAIVVAVCLLFMLAGCGPNTASQPSGTEQVSKGQLALGAGSQGGVYYPVGVGIAEVITKHVPGVTVTPEVTGASTENVVLAGSGEVDIAIATAGDLYKASRGEPPFESEINNLSIFFGGLRPGAVQIVVREDSPIQSVADLRGKRVSVGPQGGGGVQAFSELLSSYGMTLDDIQASYVSYQESAEQVADGNLDAAVIVAAWPTPAITQLANTTAIRLLPIEQNVLDKFVQDRPYYIKVTIPKDTYEGQKRDVETFATVNLVIVRDDLSDEQVYEMTKAIFDHLDELHPVHPSANAITLESATAYKGFRYHPGAARYFKEKGRDVPTK